MNRKNRKLISIITLVFMLLTIMPMGVFAASSVQLTGTADLTVGDENPTLKISISGNSTSFSALATSTSSYTLKMDGKDAGLTVKSVTTDSAYALTLTTEGTLETAGTLTVTIDKNAFVDVPDTNPSVDFTVKEKEVSVTGITLDQTKLELTSGGKAEIKATLAPENATGKVTWVADPSTGVVSIATSEDTLTATVTAAEVTEIKTAKITASVNGKTATCDVTVIPIKVEEAASPEVTVQGVAPENQETAKAIAETVKAQDEALVTAAEKIAKEDNFLKAETLAELEEAGKTPAVVPYFDIQVTSFDPEATVLFTMNIEPMYKVVAVGEETGKVYQKGPMDITTVTLTVDLKGNSAKVVRHTKSSGDIYYYSVSMAEQNATFTVTHGFSEMAFMAEEPTLTINFFDGNVEAAEATSISALDFNSAETVTLPSYSKANYRFNGWKFDALSGVTKTLDSTQFATLLDNAKDGVVNAYADLTYTGNTGGGSYGGSSGGGAAATTGTTTVTSPDSSVVITRTTVSESVLNSVTSYASKNSGITLIGNSNNTVSISATKGGQTLTSFADPLTVSMPVTAAQLSGVDTSKLTLAKVSIDANGNVSLKYVGGKYNASTGRFVAYVAEPGDYVLVSAAGLTKITLTINSTTTELNDVARRNDVAPVIIGSRTMVPVRFIAENLGAQVGWNDATRVVSISMNGQTLRMTIDQTIPGFDAAPVIRNSRTLVPIRYVSEEFGAYVLYVPSTQEVVIVK